MRKIVKRATSDGDNNARGELRMVSWDACEHLNGGRELIVVEMV